MVIEEAVQIPIADGVCQSFLYREQDASLRRGGVIHLTDIGGIRPSHKGMAQRLAEQGYLVLMPNLFYRTGEPPVFDFPLNMAEERTRKRLHELTEPLTPEAMELDASAYVDFLAGQPGTAPGPMGVVGYCFSGSMALRTAAARPDRVSAAASFHGGSLFTGDATSPHRVLPQVKARLYFGHAVEDRSMPPEAIDGMNKALAGWRGRYESEVYDGARHGWTVPDSAAYNAAQAERAFGKLTDLLSQTMKSA
jgi:carboxymethylenebutenolidase